MIAEEHPEEEVRKLRDQVFGVPATEKGWDACKDNWTRADSVEWLKEQIEKIGGQDGDV
jgi:hypothetical protein